MLRRARLAPARQGNKMDSGLAIVNIVLLLIFFFLTTGSLSNSTTVTVSLPETTELPLDLLPKPLLTVSLEGDLTLDGVPIERGALADALIDDPMLHVLADREANAGELLDLIAAEELIAVQVRLVTVHRKDAEDAE
ncbi:biopolymer transporter ExbD [uncultured Tateyamaria sp.]|uniref:ExbD/TolR family protein n=1 Tax=Tateyamaria sp. 1078 TaxID=3417464 RepID=UPI002614E4A4|nr:biopolymer transporter ExbD [uncultured Tateyamaria sp.]